VTKDQAGIKTKFWFWGADQFPKVVSKPVEKPKTEPVAEETVLDLLAQNPNISGSTFYNLLMSKGYKIEKPKVEADAAATNVPVLRAQESMKLSSRFLESAPSDNGIGPTRFHAVLLQEGLGNLNDAFYYTSSAIESAVPVFEGKKIYADHPSLDDERTRPERSVRDILGHFESIKVEESKDGRKMLVGDLIVLPDKQFEWARGLMRHAVEFSQKYPDKDFVGLSINASGDTNPMALDEFMKEATIPESILPKLQKAKEIGITEVRLVTSITDALSCDLVTEAGAGGRLLGLSKKGE